MRRYPRKFRMHLFALLSFLALFPHAALAAEESIVVTTYYPSPYGVYGEMRLYPKPYSQATPCDANQEGLMFYDNDSSAHTLKVCRCINAPTCVTSSDFGWVSAANYWTLTGTNLYPNNNNWNVGIGTTSPATALDVRGTLTIRAPDGGAGGTLSSVSTSGALVYTPASSGGYSVVHIFKNRSGGDIMDLDGTGSVGIGTPAPSTRLHIAGPSTGAIKIEDGNQAAGRVLTSDASGVGTWQPPGGGGMSNIRVYTASGAFTVPAGITKLWVEVYGGGGGGGGGCGGGGGAGGVAMGFVTVSPGQSIAVTVGAGGCSGCGGSGGNSSFLTLVATGGTGGYSNSSNWNQGGVGGFSSGGSINQRGGPGAIGIMFCNSPTWCGNCIGGTGGYNTRGVGGSGVFIGQESGSIFGGGGGGAPVNGCSGGCGGSGGVIIWY